MGKRVCGAFTCLFFLLLSPRLVASPQRSQGGEDLLKKLEKRDVLSQPEEQPAEVPSGQRPKDHWTPYYPPNPATISPNLKVHIIQKGDTLWGIAATYLGNGLLWPQIWEVNKYITDAHWIYPGDPVVIPQPLLVSEVQEEVPPPRKIDLIRPAEPQPMASASDVNCSFFIAEQEKKTSKKKAEKEALLAPRIIGGEDNTKIGFATGDVVYLNIGVNNGVIPGDEYVVIRKEGLVYHPATGKLIGRHVDMVSRLIVIAVQDETSTARIDQACDISEVGNAIIPYTQIPIPLASGYVPTSRYWTQSSGKQTGYIVTTKDGIIGASEGGLVGIDMGSQEGVVPGDFLTVFRPNPLGEGLPRRILGDVVVLTVKDNTATSKIVTSYETIQRGDQVELK